jgi:peroxiredoxin Q/BCP
MRPAFLVLLVFALASPRPGAAQELGKSPPAPPPRESTPSSADPHAQLHIAGRVEIGDRAPDFELDGSRGQPVRLSRLRGDWLVLAFADRRTDLADLRSVEKEMQGIGARIIGVCHEKARTLEMNAARDSIPFLLLADVTGEIASIYGLYDGARNEVRPGFVVLDRDGFVRIAFLGQQLPADEVARLAHFAVAGF